MALWYKAWRESRTRFLIFAGALAVYSVGAAHVDLDRLGLPSPMTYAKYIWLMVYDGPAQILFAVFAALLGLGGLYAERTTGTQAFTLALPATRRRLVCVRSALALTQVVLLGSIPALIIPPLSRLYQVTPYPADQAAMFAVLSVACGAVWCAAGILWSSLLGNDHVVIAACLLTPLAGWALHRNTGLGGSLDLFQIMNGVATAQFNRSTWLLEAPVPWLPLLGLSTVAGGLLIAAAWMMERADF